MPCHAAMIAKPMTVSPDDEVGKVLADMKDKDFDAVAVVAKDGTLEGLLSIKVLLQNLLPVSVSMADGLQMDITVQAAPGIAKRLKKVEPLHVSEIMTRKVHIVYPETALWEGVNLLVQYGAPLVVVEGETKKFVGLITFQSALNELNRLKDSET